MSMGRAAMRPYTPLPQRGRRAGGEGKKKRALPAQRTQAMYPCQEGLGLQATARPAYWQYRIGNGAFMPHGAHGPKGRLSPSAQQGG
jgi:hypothetical protein